MKLPSKVSAALTNALRDGLPQDHAIHVLIDGAHDPQLLPQIVRSGHRYACLFDELEASHLTHAAPYLVELPEDHDLVGLLGRGFGRKWYSFVRTAAHFDTLLHHLRRYAKCRHDTGKGHTIDAYFAYWDPRVAADWFATLRGEEAQQFFDPIEAVFAEDPNSAGCLIAYRLQEEKVVAQHLGVFPDQEMPA